MHQSGHVRNWKIQDAEHQFLSYSNPEQKGTRGKPGECRDASHCNSHLLSIFSLLTHFHPFSIFLVFQISLKPVQRWVGLYAQRVGHLLDLFKHAERLGYLAPLVLVAGQHPTSSNHSSLSIGMSGTISASSGTIRHINFFNNYSPISHWSSSRDLGLIHDPLVWHGNLTGFPSNASAAGAHAPQRHGELRNHRGALSAEDHWESVEGDMVSLLALCVAIPRSASGHGCARKSGVETIKLGGWWSTIMTSDQYGKCFEPTSGSGWQNKNWALLRWR